MTLIVELNADDKLWTALTKEDPADIYVVSESARPWLSNDLQQLLDKSKNATLTVSDKSNCKPYATQLTKTGKPVSGFLCKGTNRFLLYMMVLPGGPD